MAVKRSCSHLTKNRRRPKRTRKTSAKANATEQEYNVLAIIDEQFIDGVRHYQLKWEGDFKDSWEPKDNVGDGLIADWCAQQALRALDTAVDAIKAADAIEANPAETPTPNDALVGPTTGSTKVMNYLRKLKVVLAHLSGLTVPDPVVACDATIVSDNAADKLQEAAEVGRSANKGNEGDEEDEANTGDKDAEATTGDKEDEASTGDKVDEANGGVEGT